MALQSGFHGANSFVNEPQCALCGFVSTKGPRCVKSRKLVIVAEISEHKFAGANLQ